MAAGDGVIAFSYARFWHWWRGDEGGVLEPTDDIIVRVCDADYRAMKYKKGVVAPFLTRNMAAFRVTDPSLLSAGDRLFENGLFMVMERAALSDAVRSRLPESDPSGGDQERVRDSAMRKKWLFAVCPRMHARGAPGGGPLLAGDHFTFVIGCSPTPLHLHVTEYVPNMGLGNQDPVAQDVQGNTRPTEAYLPLDFLIPRDVVAFNRFVPKLRADDHAAPLHRLLRRPFVSGDSSGSSTGQGGGGGPGRRRARRHAQARGGPGASRAFEDLWYELPLHRIVIVGARRAGGYDFVVTIRDRLAHDIGMLRPSATFRLSAAAARDDVKVYDAVSHAMSGLTWASFVDPPPMPGDDD